MAHDKKHGSHSEHHILPESTAVKIGVALLILTVITVWIAGIDLGRLNFVVAMLVATVKAGLVAMIFMGLWYDKAENGMIFLTSFLFLAIFIGLTSTDMFFRGDVYVKEKWELASSGGSKLKKPWLSTPELVGKGKELYSIQCASCHGASGMGNGPAAASLTPPPRNFTADAGWKNGRKPSMVFKTLKEGLPGSAMASFATLGIDDRWALVHYVMSLGPSAVQDSAADLAKIGVDPSKETMGGGQEVTLPIAFAMERIAQSDRPLHGGRVPRMKPAAGEAGSMGARVYEAQCATCHGARGEGGIKVKHLGVNPVAYVTTTAFKDAPAAQSQEAFNRVVTRGLPGSLMPAESQLSAAELRDLFQYVRNLQGR